MILDRLLLCCSRVPDQQDCLEPQSQCYSLKAVAVSQYQPELTAHTGGDLYCPLSSAISSLLFVIQPRHGPGDVEGVALLPPHRQPEAAGWFAYNENQLFLRTLHT